MKTTIKIAYSENTKAVLAETKLEVEFEQDPTIEQIDSIKLKAKDIFEDAQNYAIKQTVRRM